MTSSNKKLPQRLGKEPIVDAVFELRFASTVSASNVLPGIFYAYFCEKYGDDYDVSDLPLSQLPESFRRSDPVLQYSASKSLNVGQYSILIGDHSVAIRCNLPYPGWNEFSRFIREVMDVLRQSGVVLNVSRYSIKYVDLIPSENVSEQVGFINIHLSLAKHQLTEEIVSIRLELPKGEYIHILTLQTGVSMIADKNLKREGVIVDVDTICRVPNLSMQDFLSTLPASLDTLHAVNKQLFFDCLTEKALNILDPVYD